jgi:predicted AlkP superfamily phosphohydrolase/phosphomutase
MDDPLKARLLVIALDACDKGVVRAWAADGSLPTFRRLFADAVQGETSNPAGFFGGTVWPSFSTGLWPGGHGRFCAVQVPRGEYGARPFPSAAIDGVPFWERASEAGRRVAIIDAPLSRPAGDLNGLQIVDYATHDGFFPHAVTSPPSLVEELRAGFGPGFQDRCEASSDLVLRRDGIERFVDELLRRVRAKGELSRHYLRQGGWDLFLTTFGESHCVGHQCWHLHDPSHPLHDATLAGEVGDPVKRVYQALDTEIAALLATAGPEARAIVWLTHGMGRMTKAPDTVLDEILLRLQPSAQSLRSRVFQYLKLTWYRLPPTARRWAALKSLKRGVTSGLHGALALTDRRDRQFFAMPADTSVGAVRVNLAGREGSGRVSPGSQYRTLLGALCRDLAEIADPMTGARLIKAIHVTADLFQGSHQDQLPDLLLEWNHDQHFESVSSGKIGIVRVPDVIGRTGEHRNGGMFFGLGGSAEAVALTNPVPVVDLTATICELLDVPVDGLHGRAREELRLLGPIPPRT